MDPRTDSSAKIAGEKHYAEDGSRNVKSPFTLTPAEAECINLQNNGLRRELVLSAANRIHRQGAFYRRCTSPVPLAVSIDQY